MCRSVLDRSPCACYLFTPFSLGHFELTGSPLAYYGLQGEERGGPGSESTEMEEGATDLARDEASDAEAPRVRRSSVVVRNVTHV